MTETIVVVGAAIVAVGLFVLGLSITQIRKGRDLESDVGSNREMKRMGIECASAQIRREEAERQGKSASSFVACDGSCGTCSATERCGESE